MTVADTEAEVTPALFEYAVKVYEEMLSQSQKEYPVTEDNEGNDRELAPVDVYEGHLTRLFSELGIANPYYTKVMDALKGQGCVAQIRRGGGVATSKWQMCFPPKEDGFKAIMERRRGPQGKHAILEQRVKDLVRLVSVLEGEVERLSDGYQKLSDDIKRLKS